MPIRCRADPPQPHQVPVWHLEDFPVEVAGLLEEGPGAAQAGESSWRAWLSVLPCPSRVLLFFDLSVPLLPQVGFLCVQSALLSVAEWAQGPMPATPHLRPQPRILGLVGFT